MIPDSLLRQFLLSKKNFFKISALEQEFGITGKSIERWIKGKRPLPTKWEDPLRKILYPMVDEQNELHKEHYKFDKVVVLEKNHILKKIPVLPS